jgi:glutamyl-tRNA synthetase
MIKYFSIEKIRKSPSKFDIDKLNDINSIYLKNTPIETLISKIDSSHSNLSEKKFKSLSIVMPEILKRCKNIKDIEKNINFIINERPIKIDNEANKLINDVSLNSLEKLSKILKKLDKWDANEIEHTIKNFLKDEGLNFKDIGLPLRAVLVGFLSPIGINTIIESLGKDEVLARIEDIIK